MVVKTEPTLEDQLTPEVVADLRTQKVPCPKCASQMVVFAEEKPKVDNYMGKPTVLDLMRCLGCAAYYEQFYY